MQKTQYFPNQNPTNISAVFQASVLKLVSNQSNFSVGDRTALSAVLVQARHFWGQFSASSGAQFFC